MTEVNLKNLFQQFQLWL